MRRQIKPTLTPLPCPFCGSTPALHPKNWRLEGDAWGEVRCENSRCAAKPSARDGESVSDELTALDLDTAIAQNTAALRRLMAERDVLRRRQPYVVPRPCDCCGKRPKVKDAGLPYSLMTESRLTVNCVNECRPAVTAKGKDFGDAVQGAHRMWNARRCLCGHAPEVAEMDAPDVWVWCSDRKCKRMPIMVVEALVGGPVEVGAGCGP